MTCSNSDHFIRMRAWARGEFLTEPPFCHPEPFDGACPELAEGLRINSAKGLVLPKPMRCFAALKMTTPECSPLGEAFSAAAAPFRKAETFGYRNTES